MTRGIIEPFAVAFDEAVKRIVKKKSEAKKEEKQNKLSAFKAAHSKK